MFAVVALRWFCWLSAGPIPDGQDLRRLGWERRPGFSAPAQTEVCVCLASPARLSTAEWFALVAAPPGHRQATLITGIEDSADRERLLRLGFGDAIGPDVALGELEVRALKVSDNAITIPRTRVAGPLQLDLIARDARIAGRRVGLHPREFALLWRLADRPGEVMAADHLRRDVWQMSFRPETNSLAVHVSRLRAKLRTAGADGLIETADNGGYRLTSDPAPSVPLFLSDRAAEFGLDAHVRLREESPTMEQEASHEA